MKGGVSIKLGPAMQEKQTIIDDLQAQNQNLNHALAQATAKLHSYEQSCTKYADDLLEAKSRISNLMHENSQLKEQIEYQTTQLNMKHNDLTKISTQNDQQTKIASTMQLQHDQLQYELNQVKDQLNQTQSDNNLLQQALSKFESANEKLSKEFQYKEHELELMKKGRDHAEKHSAMLLRQKEKYLQQIDQLTGTTTAASAIGKQTGDKSMNDSMNRSASGTTFGKANSQQKSAIGLLGSKNALLREVGSATNLNQKTTKTTNSNITTTTTSNSTGAGVVVKTDQTKVNSLRQVPANLPKRPQTSKKSTPVVVQNKPETTTNKM